MGVGSKRKAPEVIAVDDAPQGGEDIVCLGSAAVPEGAQKPESQRGASSSGEAVVDKGGAGEEEVGLPEGVDGIIGEIFICWVQKRKPCCSILPSVVAVAMTMAGVAAGAAANSLRCDLLCFCIFAFAVGAESVFGGTCVVSPSAA